MANTRSTYSKRNYRTKFSGSYGGFGSYGTTKTTGTWTSKAYNPTQFSNYRKTVQAYIVSFRNLNQQFSGTSRVTAFSPSTAKTWINFVNNGNYVYKFTNQQFCQTFGTQWNTATPTAAFKYLRYRFGNGIRAVTRGRSNTWLVCASPNVTGRPFSTYNWK